MKEKGVQFNKLSQINSNNGIRLSKYSASPGCHCPMHTALATIGRIKGISSLVVGMPECGFYSRYVMDSPKGEQGELHYTYILDSNEVVFGCRDGLKDALVQMVEEGAKAIVVVMTCIPALIGEDIKEVTQEISLECDAKAVCIDMAHFKRNGYEAGYYEVLGSINGLIEPQAVATEQMVGILGPLSGEEGEELKRILLDHNYECRIFDLGYHIDELAQIKKAKLTIVTSLYYLPFAKELYKKYQIPYINLTISYSPDLIWIQYQELFDKLQIKPEFEAFPAYEKLMELHTMESSCFNGVDFTITAILPDTLAVAAYLCSFSMRPTLLHIEEYNEYMKSWRDEILTSGCDPEVTYVVNKDDISEILNNKSSVKTLSLGSAGKALQFRTIEDRGLQSLQRLLGFERSYKLMKLIRKGLEG